MDCRFYLLTSSFALVLTIVMLMCHCGLILINYFTLFFMCFLMQHAFVGFGGNVIRQRVQASAGLFVTKFDELLELV